MPYPDSAGQRNSPLQQEVSNDAQAVTKSPLLKASILFLKLGLSSHPALPRRMMSVRQNGIIVFIVQLLPRITTIVGQMVAVRFFIGIVLKGF
jgi:hypothetical protein